MPKESSLQFIRESLGRLRQPVRVVLFTSDAEHESCADARETARAIKAASAKVALEQYDIAMDRDKSEEYGVRRVPCFVVQAQDGRAIRFSGSLEGVSLLLLLEAVRSIDEGRAWFPERIGATLGLLGQRVPVLVLLENDCTLCRPVAETAIGLALTSGLVAAEIAVADEFPELLKQYQVRILPFTVFGPRLTLEGHASESELLEMLFAAERRKEAGMDSRCIVCGQPSPSMICEPCKTRIQAEALNHKRQDEKFMERGSGGAQRHG